MRNARIEQSGSPQDIYDKPRTSFVYEFLGEVNKLAGDRYVRPHEIDLKFAAEEGVDLTGRVTHLFVAGPFARLSVVPESGPRWKGNWRLGNSILGVALQLLACGVDLTHWVKCPESLSH
jgi:hypothetical protein